jgi:hypothetical protein
MRVTQSVVLVACLGAALTLDIGRGALEPEAALAIQLQPEENVSESGEPSALTQMSPQSVAVDAQGRAIVVWSEFVDQKSPPELWMRVRGQGTGFGPRLPLTQPDEIYSGDAAVAADSAGGVHLAWVDKKSGKLEVWVAGIEPSSGKLVGSQAISSGAGMVMDPAIAVGPGGQLAVAWTSMEAMNYELRLRRRSAKGAWGEVEAVTPADRRASDQVSIAYGPDGRLHLAWADNRLGARRILAAVLGPSGLEPAVEVSPTEEGKQTRPFLAVDARGQVALAWQDSQFGADEIFVALAPAGGKFGTPLRIAPGIGPARSPCIVAGPDGVTHLLWEDARPDPKAEEPSVQIYYARLAGTKLTDQSAITTDRPVSCFNPSAVVDARGALHLVWVNQGIGEGDVIYRQTAPAGAPGAAAR